MNIVFFGSANFSIPFLRTILSSSYRISVVVTQPDRPRGRGLILSRTPVKELAIENNLKVYQPKRINTDEVADYLKAINPDLFIVVAYGEILSKKILEIPNIFSINVHASLLPKYRGAAPINWAIINGEVETGISIMKMDEALDSGSIILQISIPIDKDDNAKTLEEKLSRLGSQLLLESLDRIKNNNYSLIPQDESRGISFAPQLKKEDGLINWSKTAVQINNLIRGCIGWPDGFTNYRGKRLKIFKAKIIKSNLTTNKPGQIIGLSKEGILIATGKNNILLEELQLEGKRIMQAKEFIAGRKIEIGEMFG